jgi:hypothetical protein
MAFHNRQIGFDLRLQAAIALLLEPSSWSPTLVAHACTMARLKAMKPIKTTSGPGSYRQAVAMLNRAMHACDLADAAEATLADAEPGGGNPIDPA